MATFHDRTTAPRVQGQLLSAGGAIALDRRAIGRDGWARARELAARLGGEIRDHVAEGMRQAWAAARGLLQADRPAQSRSVELPGNAGGSCRLPRRDRGSLALITPPGAPAVPHGGPVAAPGHLRRSRHRGGPRGHTAGRGEHGADREPRGRRAAARVPRRRRPVQRRGRTSRQGHDGDGVRPGAGGAVRPRPGFLDPWLHPAQAALDEAALHLRHR